jgi:hypothetical protein
MSPQEEAELRRLLEECGFKDSDYVNVDWWINENRCYGFPALKAALLLRESWRGVVRPLDTHAVVEFLSDMKLRIGDTDDYQDRVARQNPDYFEELHRLLGNEGSANAIAFLMRAAQIEAVAQLIQLIDGGETFERGLVASWGLVSHEESGECKEEFGKLIDLFWKFDPDRRR